MTRTVYRIPGNYNNVTKIVKYFGITNTIVKRIMLNQTNSLKQLNTF